MVSSIEQRDVFFRLNRNILIYYPFPPMPSVKKVHERKEPIILGYHGNRVHLECMFGGVQLALNELARRRKIEFWAVYNVARLGQAKIGIPDARLMRVRHIQWSPEVAPNSTVTTKFYEELAHVDIGIVPDAIPIRNRLKMLEQMAYPEKEFTYEPFDHLLRYKASSNPGRIYPFAQLGIPVVADFSPSSSQFIRDGESGFVVSSPYGWLEVFETLADSPDLRTRMACQLRSSMQLAFSQQIGQFLDYCQRPLKSPPVRFGHLPSAEEELGRLKNYRRPTDVAFWRRAGRRLRRLKRMWAP
jgi:glycosyltransferase involved in cell wall biosynthesis